MFPHRVPMAPLAWLAWQDGRPDDVIRIAREADSADAQAPDTRTRNRWAYLFPLAAVFLDQPDTERSLASLLPVLDSAQQALPHPLAAAIERARDAWGCGDHGEATATLWAALDLARELGFL